MALSLFFTEGCYNVSIRDCVRLFVVSVSCCCFFSKFWICLLSISFRTRAILLIFLSLSWKYNAELIFSFTDRIEIYKIFCLRTCIFMRECVRACIPFPSSLQTLFYDRAEKKVLVGRKGAIKSFVFNCRPLNHALSVLTKLILTFTCPCSCCGHVFALIYSH